MAIDTYGQALSSGALTTPAVKSAAQLFKSQHEDHLNLLKTITSDAGGEPYTEPNFYLKYEVVDPTVKSTKSQDQWLALATTLENTAAQTYNYAGGVLTTPTLRAVAHEHRGHRGSPRHRALHRPGPGAGAAVAGVDGQGGDARRVHRSQRSGEDARRCCPHQPPSRPADPRSWSATNRGDDLCWPSDPDRPQKEAPTWLCADIACC